MDDYAVKMTTEISFYVQAAAKRDSQNPAHQSRFFVFLVQHYKSRLKNIFETAEERERDLQRISRLPEMQQQQTHKTQSIAEEDENDEDERFDERSTTRASGSSLKRKMSGDMTDKNKKHPAATTVIYMYNPKISTQVLGAQSASTSPRTPPTKDGTTTVQSTPRATTT
eukprot:6261957-Amphidinium_carterae.1